MSLNFVLFMKNFMYIPNNCTSATIVTTLIKYPNTTTLGTIVPSLSFILVSFSSDALSGDGLTDRHFPSSLYSDWPLLPFPLISNVNPKTKNKQIDILKPIKILETLLLFLFTLYVVFLSYSNRLFLFLGYSCPYLP